MYAETLKAAPKKAFRTNIRDLSQIKNGDDDNGSAKEDFLQKIPKTVIQNGKIVQVEHTSLI